MGTSLPPNRNPFLNSLLGRFSFVFAHGTQRAPHQFSCETVVQELPTLPDEPVVTRQVSGQMNWTVLYAVLRKMNRTSRPAEAAQNSVLP